jgi:hypothetical protein
MDRPMAIAVMQSDMAMGAAIAVQRRGRADPMSSRPMRNISEAGYRGNGAASPDDDAGFARRP